MTGIARDSRAVGPHGVGLLQKTKSLTFLGNCASLGLSGFQGSLINPIVDANTLLFLRLRVDAASQFLFDLRLWKEDRSFIKRAWIMLWAPCAER